MAYSIVIIWLVSHAICIFILNKRKVKAGRFWELFGVFFGPFAIPFTFYIGSKEEKE